MWRSRDGTLTDRGQDPQGARAEGLWLGEQGPARVALKYSQERQASVPERAPSTLPWTPAGSRQRLRLPCLLPGSWESRAAERCAPGGVQPPVEGEALLQPSCCSTFPVPAACPRRLPTLHTSPLPTRPGREVGLRCAQEQVWALAPGLPGPCWPGVRASRRFGAKEG